MLKRLLLGLIKGALVGGALALLAVRVLGITAFDSAAVAYLGAAVAGTLTGLVAGRPIWSRGAAIEAALKVLAGAALGAGLLFAIRRWLPMELDLTLIGAGRGLIGALPATSLPLVSTLLALFFELDNTGDGAAALPPKTRVSPGATGERVRDEEPEREAERREGQQKLRH